MFKARPREAHHINFDEMYPAWGLAENQNKALNVQAATPDQVNAALTHIEALDVNLENFKFVHTAIVAYYQGPKHPKIQAIWLRFTKTGEMNLGHEHISFLFDTNNWQLLGLTRMLERCDNKTFLSPNEALSKAFTFLKKNAKDLVGIDGVPGISIQDTLASGEGVDLNTMDDDKITQPGISIGEVSVMWIDDHAEKLLSEDGKATEVHGMKVKMRFNDGSERYTWVIVDKYGDIQTFERNIFWDFEQVRRETQMWLHDGWLATHELLN